MYVCMYIGFRLGMSVSARFPGVVLVLLWLRRCLNSKTFNGS